MFFSVPYFKFRNLNYAMQMLASYRGANSNAYRGLASGINDNVLGAMQLGVTGTCGTGDSCARLIFENHQAGQIKQVSRRFGPWTTNLNRHTSISFYILKIMDFPGGSVVKNPPANAGDTGSSPGPGRSHMQQSS